MSVVRAEQRPGRRRAAPRPRRSAARALRRSPAPAAAASKGGRSPRERTPRSRGGRVLRALWLALLVAGTAAVVLPWTPLAAPSYVPLAGAVAVTSAFAVGLGARTGGRPLGSGGLALALSGAAAVTQSGVLLAGAATATAVMAAVLAVLSTTPAARFLGVVREVAVATVVAAVGAFAVRGYDAEVSFERIGYLALGFSLLGALGVVYRLGAGLHGLGRRGFVMILSGLLLLTLTLAYTEALSAWGSQGMIDRADAVLDSVRGTLAAVPRPVEVLLGFPALAWGVSTRARRRQGWWVCAFGAAGFSVIAVSLLDPDMTLAQSGLSLLYSLVLGLLAGYLVIRTDQFLTGPRGRRARRLEEQAAHRPEPGRLSPLL